MKWELWVLAIKLPMGEKWNSLTTLSQTGSLDPAKKEVQKLYLSWGSTDSPYVFPIKQKHHLSYDCFTNYIFHNNYNDSFT